MRKSKWWEGTACGISMTKNDLPRQHCPCTLEKLFSGLGGFPYEFTYMGVHYKQVIKATQQEVIDAPDSDGQIVITIHINKKEVKS